MTSSWPMVKLSEICDLTMGRTPSRSDRSLWDPSKSSSNVWVSISDMPLNPMSKITDSKEYISDLAATKFPVVPRGTLMMSFKLSVGRTAIADVDLRTNEAIIAFRNLDPRRINLNFLGYYLSYFNWSFHMQGDEKLLGATMNKAKLQNLEVPLPPLDEQKRIVAKLDEALADLDQVTTNANGAINETESLWSAYLKESFDSGPESARRMTTSHWPVAKVEEISEIVTRGISPVYGEHGKVLVLNQRCIRGGKVLGEFARRHDSTKKSVSEKKFINQGDILINSTGVGTVGRSAVVTEDIPYGEQTVDSHVTIVRSLTNLVDANYLHMAFVALESLLVSRAQGSGGQVELARAEISNLEIPLPPLEEQKRIVTKLAAMNNEIEVMKRRKQEILQESVNLRSSILGAAFAGDF